MSCNSFMKYGYKGLVSILCLSIALYSPAPLAASEPPPEELLVELTESQATALDNRHLSPEFLNNYSAEQFRALQSVIQSGDDSALKQWLNDLQFIDPNTRPQIRTSYSAEKCITFFCPSEVTSSGKRHVNKSVGIPVTSGNAQSFEKEIREMIREGRGDLLDGSVFYVAGVDLRNERQVYDDYGAVLEKLNLDNKVTLKVIPMVKEELNLLSVRAAKVMLQRFKYWFPSIKRHFEKPTTEEVLWGLGLSALVEAKNLHYLATSMDSSLDASLTIGAHTVTVAAMVIFTKFIMNWVLQPGSSNMANFLKQLSLGLPFVVIYNVFGNYTEMMNFIALNDVPTIMNQFGDELISFGKSQTFTLLLQTMFYYTVIARMLGTWMSSVQGETQSEDARVWFRILETPALALNAWILAIASGTPATLSLTEWLGTAATGVPALDTVVNTMGGILNNGHVYLTGLTLASLGIYKVITEPSFKSYQWARRKAPSHFKEMIRYGLGVDLEVARITVKQKAQSCLQTVRKALRRN